MLQPPVAATATVFVRGPSMYCRHERTLQRAGYEIKRGETAPEVPDQLITPSGTDEVVPVTFN
jgi:hypothetical protein